MGIPKDEWLHLAKRVPVGQSRRVRHNTESTNAMVVGQTEEKYWCKCHRCHDGGVVEKDLVPLGKVTVEPYFQALPNDCIPLRDDIGGALYSKRLGRKLPHPTPDGWLFSKSADRLILRLQNGFVGRSLRVDHPSKWIAYASQDGRYPQYGVFPEVFEGGRVGPVPVVITEDALSMNAVRFSLGESVLPITSLGTVLQSSLVSLLVGLQCPVIVFFDDDQAGYDGAEVAVTRLKGLGIKATSAFPTLGRDPKDMLVAEIKETIERSAHGF